jgi:hypothetical protein
MPSATCWRRPAAGGAGRARPAVQPVQLYAALGGGSAQLPPPTAIPENIPERNTMNAPSKNGSPPPPSPLAPRAAYFAWTTPPRQRPGRGLRQRQWPHRSHRDRRGHQAARPRAEACWSPKATSSRPASPGPHGDGTPCRPSARGRGPPRPGQHGVATAAPPGGRRQAAITAAAPRSRVRARRWTRRAGHGGAHRRRAARRALVAPRDGRVQYRVAQPGEVLGAGGKVLNLVDLSDVYMTFFLPEPWPAAWRWAARCASCSTPRRST